MQVNQEMSKLIDETNAEFEKVHEEKERTFDELSKMLYEALVNARITLDNITMARALMRNDEKSFFCPQCERPLSNNHCNCEGRGI